MRSMLTKGLQNVSSENIHYPVGGGGNLFSVFEIIVSRCLWELSCLRIMNFCICMGVLAIVPLDFLHQSTKIFTPQESRLFIFYLSSSLSICNAGAWHKDLTIALQWSYSPSLSLSGHHVSVYCFPCHVFMSVPYREGRRQYPKSSCFCKASHTGLWTERVLCHSSAWAPSVSQPSKQWLAAPHISELRHCQMDQSSK